MKLFTINIDPDCMEGYRIFSDTPYEISIAVKLALESGATEINIIESNSLEILTYNNRNEEN